MSKPDYEGIYNKQIELTHNLKNSSDLIIQKMEEKINLQAQIIDSLEKMDSLFADVTKRKIIGWSILSFIAGCATILLFKN